MSHEITEREDGKAEFAFVGSRSDIWHGLGQALTEDASIETWKTEAGMDWIANESPVIFNTGNGEQAIMPDRKLLFRSDNLNPLAVVGSDYKVVQPGEVLEFFDELTRINGMKLSTAGTLFGGKRFWALADVGQNGEVTKGDEVKSYILLVTSVDGTLSTQARFTSTRVVCNNTMQVSLGGYSKKFVKSTHHKTFDATQVKIDMGLLGQSWNEYMENIRALSEFQMNESETRRFYESVFYDESKEVDKQPLKNLRTVEMLMERAFAGIGNELSAGTAWGALNGATELFTHWKGNRDPSIQFWDSYVGTQSDKKELVYNKLLEVVKQ